MSYGGLSTRRHLSERAANSPRPTRTGANHRGAFKDDLVSEQFCTESAQSAGLGSRRWLLQVSRTKVGRALLEG
jgi:hypothetical protein